MIPQSCLLIETKKFPILDGEKKEELTNENMYGIYSDPDATGNPERYAVMPSILESKKWSWSKFGSVDVSNDVLEVIGIVERVFKNDKEISAVTRHDDYPFQ